MSFKKALLNSALLYAAIDNISFKLSAATIFTTSETTSGKLSR